MSLPASAAAVPAATVILVREGTGGPEVYMVQRHAQMAFMGGAHVFPGGRVDEADRRMASDPTLAPVEPGEPRLDGLDEPDGRAYLVAAARELFEEAGILLAVGRDGGALDLDRASPPWLLEWRHGLSRRDITLSSVLAAMRARLTLSGLVSLSHWVTPAGEPRRYDTRFFVTRLPRAQRAAHDTLEATDGIWIRPADAVAANAQRRLRLPPPTLRTLQDFSDLADVETVLARTGRVPYRRLEPVLAQAGGRRMLVLPGDPLYPASDEAPVEGDTRFVFDDGFWDSTRG
jgi:8-oxo-dGTP pyrophosphatase MutT (NUDIX family)